MDVAQLSGLGEIALYGTAVWGLIRIAIATYEDAKNGVMLRERSDAALFKSDALIVKKEINGGTK